MTCSPSTTRRSILSGAIAATFVAVPAKALVDPRQRIQNAVTELKAALVAYDPAIIGWMEADLTSPVPDPEDRCRFTLSAFTYKL